MWRNTFSLTVASLLCLTVPVVALAEPVRKYINYQFLYKFEYNTEHVLEITESRPPYPMPGLILHLEDEEIRVYGSHGEVYDIETWDREEEWAILSGISRRDETPQEYEKMKELHFNNRVKNCLKIPLPDSYFGAYYHCPDGIHAAIPRRTEDFKHDYYVRYFFTDIPQNVELFEQILISFKPRPYFYFKDHKTLDDYKEF